MSKSPRRYYEKEIIAMPPGLERLVLRILTYHVGKDQAIGKPELLAELAKAGMPAAERQARAAITSLRKQGKLICSSSGEGGYYLAQSIEEYAEFAQVEYRSKIADMADTLRAMDDGARNIFHGAVDGQPAKQAGLW